MAAALCCLVARTIQLQALQETATAPQQPGTTKVPKLGNVTVATVPKLGNATAGHITQAQAG